MKVTVIFVLSSLSYFAPIVLSSKATCMPGYYITDSQSCQTCPKGTFQPDADQHGCKPCPDGKVSTEEGSTECIKCEKNKTPSELKDECVCVVGSIPDRKGNCTLCKPGFYFVEFRSGRTFCFGCSSGTYQPDSGQSSCLQCPDGTSSTIRARKCLSCPKGQFPLRNGECGTCPPGKTSSYLGYCVKCDKGTFKASIGTGPCILCPPNTTSESGASKCEPSTCPEGEAPLGKKGKCGKCSAGFYYSSKNRNCYKCSRGFFMPYEGVAEYCFACASSSFTEKKGATTCLECPLGQKPLKDNGKTICGTCPPGTEHDYNDLSCKRCGFNHYIASNAEFCRECPDRTYSLPGSSTCFTCPDGQALIRKTRKCGVCPAGFFYGDARCVRCRGNYAKSSPGIERCEYCPVGTAPNKNRTACIRI